MRKWRVGTISMGVSLIFLGIILFLSQVKGFEMIDMAIVWWPLILIVLGVEITAYVFLSKNENPVVKYDILSILFVGILGMVGIGFMILTTSGIMNEVRNVVKAEERTIDIPSVEVQVAKEIERIVIQSDIQLTVEGVATNEVNLFGTYRQTQARDEQDELEETDVLTTRTVGNTMYVTVKKLSTKQGLFQYYPQLDATLVVPNDVQVEIRGNNQSLDLYPGTIKNDWTVQSSSTVSVYLPQQADLLLTAKMNKNNIDPKTKWDTLESVAEENSALPEEERTYHGNETYKGTMKIGEGAYRLDIMNSEHVTVQKVDQK